MCRSQDFCTELGEDSSSWSRRSPLALPSWMDEQLNIFEEAIQLFVTGDTQGCIAILSKTRNDEMRDWYIEHGQVSGKHRSRLLARSKPEDTDVAKRDPLRSPAKFENQVFARDGFHCRYCGIRLVSGKVLKALIKALNSTDFRRGPRNIDTHGILCIFYPSADHVIPWNKGGRTDLTNLVTSCVPCNFGKDQFTVEQIGIENPFQREPLMDDWDGLLSYLDGIKQTTSQL